MFKFSEKMIVRVYIFTIILVTVFISMNHSISQIREGAPVLEITAEQFLDEVGQDLTYRIKEHNESKVSRFSTVIFDSQLKKLASSNYSIVVSRFDSQGFKVFFNDNYLGTEGSFEKGNSNLWNTTSIFYIPNEYIKAKNLLTIKSYSDYEVGLGESVKIASEENAKHIYSINKFFSDDMSFISISIFLAMFLCSVFVLFFVKKNKLFYSLLSIACILMVIYSVSYLKIVDMGIDYLTYKKIIIVSIPTILTLLSFMTFKITKNRLPLYFGFTLLSIHLIGIYYCDNMIDYKIFYERIYYLLIVHQVINLMILAKFKSKRTIHHVLFGGMALFLGVTVVEVITLVFAPEYIISSTLHLAIVFLVLMILLVVHDFLEGQNQLTVQIEKTEFLRKNIKLDEMTGLFNQRYLKQYLTTLNNSEIERVGVYHIKIDNLKVVNEMYGYDFADELLKLIANRIRIFMSSDKTIKIFRIHGSGFVCVSLDEKSILKYSNNEFDKLQVKELHAPYLIDGISVSVTFSIGFAAAPMHTNNLEELANFAEVAMNTTRYRNVTTLEIFDNELYQDIIYTRHVIEEVRASNIEEEFDMYFQPVVNGITNEIVSYEALIRWKHPERGILSPYFFLEIIEKSGQLNDITMTMFEKTLKMIKVMKEKGNQSFRVSFNLTDVELNNKKFVPLTKQFIDNNDVAAEDIIFELTERCLIEGNEIVSQNIRSLRELGFKIAIDDFGVEYSSLSKLNDIEFDILKIDKKFVSTIDEPTTFSILKMIKEIITQKDIDCIVEGVEDIEQLEKILALGFKYIQGYFYYKPMELDKILSLDENEYLIS